MRLIYALVLLSVLAGCADDPKKRNLYYWGEYPDLVYQHAKDTENIDESIAKLEKIITTNKAKNRKNPPGLKAHLAVLYLQIGDEFRAAKLLEEEKKDFPPATIFIDFQLKGLQKSNQQGVSK